MMFKTLSGCCQEALRRHNGRSEDAQRTLIKKGKNPINFKWHFSNLKLTRVTLENRKMHAFWCATTHKGITSDTCHVPSYR